MSFSSQKKIPSNNPPANGIASQSTQPVCTWSAHAPKSGPSPSPFPRSYHSLTAIATAAGELFLFGGYDFGSRLQRKSGDLYVISTRDFSTTILQTSGEVPTPRWDHGTALIGTTLLICGGDTRHNGVAPNAPLYLLNLGTSDPLMSKSREWSRVVVNGPGPGSRRSHTTTVVGSKLIVFGGVSSGKTTNDMWALDLNCLKSQPLWESYEPTPGNEKPLPRWSHVLVTTEDRIIIFGGFSDEHYYNDTWSFDISTRKWTELQCTGSIPSPRGGHTAVLVDDVMYVFGGSSWDQGIIVEDDLYALHLSTQRWFKFPNQGTSPCKRAGHTMASDGTRVFVLGGYSSNPRENEVSLIHVFDTKDIKCPEMLERRLSASLAVQNERNHRIAQLTEELALKSDLLEQAEANVAGLLLMQTSLVEQRDAELVDMQARLDELVVSRGQQVGQYENELGNVRIKLEANESELETVRLRLADAEKGRTSLDVLVASRDQEVEQYEKELTNVRAKLEAKEPELEAVRLRLADAETSLDELVVFRDQQVGQHEKELTNVRAKLEANESELEAIRLRLTDAEKGLAKSKAEADTLRAQNATGSVNRDENQVTRRLMERVRVIEAEMASKRWNEKSIGEMECRNEKSIEEMEYTNEG
ncbi:hypothetical protein BGY98DRAFT_1102241 [Russula aff. rugulosa BPL654]|nr:hypothetical protein BGY98DRAFT_1102241 [Russula aff. rugulosa BPL654]